MTSKKNKPEGSRKKLTPRQLLKKRIKNPDLKITEDDIKNLKIGPEVDDIGEEESEKLKEVKAK